MMKNHAFFCLAASLAIVAGVAGTAHAEGLLPHRAIYDLKLREVRGNVAISAVSGRIAYEFRGSPCEGYTVQVRQVTDIDTGENGNLVTDLRLSSFEEADGSLLRIKTTSTSNRGETLQVDGQGKRDKDGTAKISLSKPKKRTFSAGASVFPTDQVRRVIAAAEAGSSTLELQVYDGSDTGQKVYSTLTVIGKTIGPGEKLPEEKAAQVDALKSSPRWPATISYFDKGGQGGEQTPAYTISFDLYRNGVTRALVLDYNDFVVSGTLSAFEVLPVPKCR